MRYVTLVARILFGLAFTVFGLNGVLMSVFDKAFMPPPKEMPEAAASFFQALTDTRFMLPLIGGVQLISGLMILTGIMVPLRFDAPSAGRRQHRPLSPLRRSDRSWNRICRTRTCVVLGVCVRTRFPAASSIRARSHAGTRTRQALRRQGHSG